ncbi:ATP-binding protein [Streptomyces griseus]|uniref:ATP-binding protein n=1 Tax=Streptomyces griseus TaxID=1911 RepID=UPI003795A8B5
MTCLRLPPTTDSPCTARHWAAGLLPDDVRETALLVLSELVTNAVAVSQGAQPPAAITLEVAVRPEHVTLRVTDLSSVAVPTAPDAVPVDAESGRGLFLIGTLSADHGWIPAGCGKCVWATLSRCPDVVSPYQEIQCAGSATA